MKTVHVKASTEYDILIGNSLLRKLGNLLEQFSSAEKVAIVSDTNVWPLYGDAVLTSVAAAGFQAMSYVFEAGESHKNSKTYLSLLNFLAENQLTRSDILIALGGGVVGDLTGFAAATYLRGIDYIQIPTTLLAAVDSSVGGKTAIDLDAGKNLAGAFYQPSLVVCDLDTLNTLPGDILHDGSAEVIKYGILYDENLFSHLHHNGLNFDREYVVSRCVELKRDVVAEDEFDRGSRQKLNLGHTIGHAIEACSNYEISHGSAVAAGMAIIARSALEKNLCDGDTVNRIVSVLTQFHLPTNSPYTAEDLTKIALSDKKRSGSTVNLIIPRQIGNCVIMKYPVEQLCSFIEAGL